MYPNSTHGHLRFHFFQLPEIFYTNFKAQFACAVNPLGDHLASGI